MAGVAANLLQGGLGFLANYGPAIAKNMIGVLTGRNTWEVSVAYK